MTMVVVIAAKTCLVFAADSLVTDDSGTTLSTKGPTKIFPFGPFGLVSYGGSRHPHGVPGAIVMLGVEQRGHLRTFESACAILHATFRPHLAPGHDHRFLIGGYEDGRQRIARLAIQAGATVEASPSDAAWIWTGGISEVAPSIGIRPTSSEDARVIARKHILSMAAAHPNAVNANVEMLNVTADGPTSP